MPDERLALDKAALTRFAAELDRLVPRTSTLGVAVSGGGDSMALMLLAAKARPGSVHAITVDHRIREGSTAEAALVGSIARRLDIPHETVTLDWPEGTPSSNLEAIARRERYDAIEQWAARHGIRFCATAHHADDQAETMLMRLARGAGLAGLAGIRQSRAQGSRLTIVRPLLDWDKALLLALVMTVGLPIVDDPMNHDSDYDRARMREALREAGFGWSHQYAASARHLAEAEDGLRWAANILFPHRVAEGNGVMAFDPRALPRDIQRRILIAIFERLGRPAPRGPDLARAMEALEQGRQSVLADLLLSRDGHVWKVAPAPPRTR
ncbi:tRNA lysidine(34) synthetase TilS [Sphingomicrobium flavum]|uniref:tRNA lysidine(34) synthetase TilS n=1 Tax=Sphingomicrobium flavum TaxID=1229164 RepID=UPI0021ADCBD3|nr:tRNA lysidine(34) synthetase TilS [Sphingomicrobium flavum]